MKGYGPRWDTRSLEERFHGFTDKSTGDGCWLWQGSTDTDGYGRIAYKGKTHKAHRLSWQIHKGQIPDGMDVCHTCDNPPCVNPDHLWLGTDADNMRDRDQKKRTANGRKIRNTATLTEHQVRTMRKLWEKDGWGKPGRAPKGSLTYSELGRRFRVTDVQAKNVILHRSWAHLA